LAREHAGALVARVRRSSLQGAVAEAMRMEMQPLSPETRRRLDLVFAPADRPIAEAMLVNECGNNLPFLAGLVMFRLERFRFAALKISGGNLESLREAIALAQLDWRDLLMAAGFGVDITAHQRWLAEDPAR